MVGPTEIFYDGRCAWCRLGARLTQRAVEPDMVMLRDFTAPAGCTLPLTVEGLEVALTARSSEGNLVRGFDAVLAIASSIPGLRRTIRLGRLAPVHAVGSALYGLLALIRPRSGPLHPR